jgi:bifunctional non-homologous end joining protein LigD
MKRAAGQGLLAKYAFARFVTHVPAPSAPVRHPLDSIEPCLPTNGHAVPTGPQWSTRIKHDGYRFICRRDGDRVCAFSRRGNDYTDRVPRIAEARSLDLSFPFNRDDDIRRSTAAKR